MSLYMLDTDVAVAVIQGGSAALDNRIATTAEQELCISAVTRGELLCGLSHTRTRSLDQSHPLSRVVDQYLSRVQCLPWDAAAASHFAMIAVELHHLGAPMASMDTMIAGHALAVDAVLVTNQKRHFSRVSGLKLEDWTDA
jgi:tRNA(fMet)-specific endonuclease VapC